MNGRMTARLTRGRPGRALMLALAMCLFWSMAVPLMAVDVLPTTAVPADTYEPDNTVATAKAASVGGAPQPHTLHATSDVDWFKLSLKAGTAYSIKTMGTPEMVLGLYDGVPSAYVKLDLFKADGTTLVQEAFPWWPSYTPTMRFKPTVTGTYYVRASVAPVDIRSGAAASEIAKGIPVSYAGLGQYNFSVTLAAPQIVGTVYDDDTGEPIAGIPVYADISDGTVRSVAGCSSDSVATFDEEGWTVVALTDGNGDYVIDTLPVGHHHLIFGEEPPWTYGYYSYYYGCIDVYSDTVTQYINVWLEPWEFAIGGTVRDTAGKALSECDVVAYQYSDGDYYSSHWESTDEQGDYYFSELSEGYEYLVAANDHLSLYDYGWEYYDETDDSDEATLLYYGGESYSDIDFTLAKRPVLFSGRVTDVRGNPLRNHPVELASSENGMYPYAWTDMDGKYAFRGYSFIVTDTVTVRFGDWDSKHVPEYYNNTTNESSATPLAVSIATPMTGIDAVLDDAAPIIGGVVTDAVTGKPLKNVEAWLYSYDEWGTWSVYDYTYTNAAGEYGFAGHLWDNEPYRLGFFDRAGIYATQWWDDRAVFDDADYIWLEGDFGFPESVAQMEEPYFIADAELNKKVPRVSDTTRFTTAVSLAREAFGPSWQDVSHVIIASGDDAAAADPLAAAGLTWAYDAPLLLVGKNYVPSEVLSAIKGMGEEVTVHVVGGKTSLPDATIAKITALDNVVDEADRIAGPNRYATAAAIAARMAKVANDRDMEQPDAVLIANGADWMKFFDALAMSAVSANTGAPVLLVSGTKVPSETWAALEGAKPDDIYMAGGTATISKTVFNQLNATPATAHRWSGPTRFDTAVSVANGAKSLGWLGFEEIGVAARVPDAMSGGAAMGMKGGPLLLCEADRLPDATKKFMLYNKGTIMHCTVFGGPKSISEAVRDQITQVIK